MTAQEGAQPLPYVRTELEQFNDLFESTLLIDADFTLDRFEEQVRSNPFSVVHIASHGQFGGSPSTTFIMAYDDTRLTLTDLERMVRLARFRDQPIELLTLSACETAEGDDRAALGLAGVAIKAGARSALATLWPVHDRATADLMAQFYQQLRDHPGRSKAKALQQAQLKLLHTRRYRDPKLWSPFLIIGNWQ